MFQTKVVGFGRGHKMVDLSFWWR